MSKWEINVRRKPALHESEADVHASLVPCLKTLPSPWGLTCDAPVSSKPGNLTTVVSLRGKLGKGIAGHITYSLRHEDYLRDNAQYDDSLILEFDPKKIDVTVIPEVLIPALVSSFNAYRVSVEDIDLAMSDWEAIKEMVEKTGCDVNGRHGVFRFSPMGFYDRALVLRETK